MLPLRTNLDGWNGVIYADYKIDRPKFGVKGNHYPSPRRDYCEVNHKVTTQY